MMPVDAFAPKARANKVTLNRESPFKPALETPIKKAAVNARSQAEIGTFVDKKKNMAYGYAKSTYYNWFHFTARDFGDEKNL